LTSSHDSSQRGARVGPGSPARGATRFAPEAFGQYYLVDPLAVGGMAEVFRAKTFGEAGFEKVLVVKRILEKYAADQGFIDMFIDEAKLSVQLTHPNIVQIFDFGKIDRNYFIAMEAVEGKDLKSILQRQAKLGEHMPIEMACMIVHQSAKGLHHAHERSDSVGLPLNIVHRDISPSNLLVSYEGQVKVADFGIADGAGGQHETQAGVLKGKYSYMSPEQSLGEPLDNRSDIFSLGICLWESLTGHRLFRRNDNGQTLTAVRSGEIPAPSNYNPKVPAELDAIVLRALQRDKDARYQRAADLQMALEEFLLPDTADRISPRLAKFMHGRFGEQIRQERERLERGSKIAAKLHAGDVEEGVLDFTFQDLQVVGQLGVGTKTVHPGKRPQANFRLVVGLVAAICLFAGVLLFVALQLSGETARSKQPDVPVLVQSEDPLGQAPKSERANAPANPTTRSAPVKTKAVTRDRPPATTGILRLRTRPVGATVLIDGAPIGRTPVNWTRGVPGQAYRVEFRLKGYQTFKKQAVAPNVGGGLVISETLRQVPVEPGALDVNTTPWARVYIDGTYIGDTPIRGHSLPAGGHRIRLSNPRLEQDTEASITIRVGETTKKYFELGQ
jgi:hypothetical protein